MLGAWSSGVHKVASFYLANLRSVTSEERTNAEHHSHHSHTQLRISIRPANEPDGLSPPRPRIPPLSTSTRLVHREVRNDRRWALRDHSAEDVRVAQGH